MLCDQVSHLLHYVDHKVFSPQLRYDFGNLSDEQRERLKMFLLKQDHARTGYCSITGFNLHHDKVLHTVFNRSSDHFDDGKWKNNPKHDEIQLKRK